MIDRRVTRQQMTPDCPRPGQVPRRSWGLFIAAWLFMVSSAAAQDPFGGPDPFGEEPRSVPVAKPAAAKKVEEPEAAETDPNVLAIRHSMPQTVFELMRATHNLMNLGRPDEARKYLQQLVNARLDDTVLSWLQAKFGSALFLRLAADEGMQPEGRTFAESVMQAAHRMARDPGRLEALIKQLSDATPAARYAAVVDLREAREEGAVALIQVLGDANRAAEHDRVREALVQLRSDAEGPLLAVMDSRDDSVRGHALHALARLGSRDAVPFLLRPVVTDGGDASLRRTLSEALVEAFGRIPSLDAAQGYLHRRCLAYFDGKVYGKPDHEDRVVLWHWDAAARIPVAVRVPARTASIHMAGRLATELVRLAPARDDYRKLYTTALLEVAQRGRSSGQPLERGEGTPFHFAAQLGSSALEQVIQFALDRGHTGAAVAALEILGEIGDVPMLMRADGQPCIACQALRHADRRVRFAAMEAILRIDPRERYPGASFMTESLGYFASNSGSRRVLIAHPRVELAQTMAGTLLEAGFETDTVVAGSGALQLAARNADYEFALISDAIDRPPARELLYQLRREPRTAGMPVALLAREENLERLQQLTGDDPLTITLPAPYEPAGMAFVVGRLRDRAGVNFVTAEERMQQAAIALDRMAALAESPEWYGYYELVGQQAAVERAMVAPPLTRSAARVLGMLATPSAQRRLVTLANQSDWPLADRRAAAVAFQVAVQRRGLLLTRDEILAQYDRYNSRATQDRATEQILGAILDTIDPPPAREAPPPAR
jgi:hypothetical protein